MKISGIFSRTLRVLFCGLMIGIVPLGCDRETGGKVITPKTFIAPTKSAIKAIDGQSLELFPSTEGEGK